jgi:hypothetical protein
MTAADGPAARADDHGTEWPDPCGVVIGDRLCLGCGFDLIGQPIAREPRYGLLATRCPSCGRVAPMEEHPAHGAWVERWAMLGAALWLLVLIAMAVGGLAFTVTITIAGSVEAADGYERRIRSALREWRDMMPDGDDYADTFRQFWTARGQELGPQLSDIEWPELTILIVPAIAAALAGAFWSLALLQWRVRRLLLAGAILVATLAVLLWISRAIVAAIPVEDPGQVAWVRLWAPLALCGGVFVSAWFLIAIALARPVARGIVRALVPPALRGALSFLWTAEGLDAPRPPQSGRPQRLVARSAKR